MHCKEPFTPARSNQVVCSYPCAIAMKRKEKEKAIKAEKTNSKRKKIDWKRKNEDQKPKLQQRINQIARLIDAGLPCLARGYHPNQIHAGHVFSRGGHTNMRFNLHNIHRQSAQSNHKHSDDIRMREGLEDEYGEPYLEFVSALQRTPVPKYTNKEYFELYQKALPIVQRLEKADRIYTPEERVRLRNQINLELGIYPEEFCIYNLSTQIAE